MRLIAVLGGITLVTALLWSMQYWSESEADEERVFLHDGRQFQKKQIDYLLAKFAEEGMSDATASKGKISVRKKYRKKCNEIIRSSDFSKLSSSTESQTGMLARSFLSPTDKENLEKTKKLNTLKSILVQISGIRDAIIVYDQAKASSFKRQLIHSAVVTLWAKEGHVIEQLHAATARQIVKSSFAGMEEDDVLVVDGDTGLTFSATEESKIDKVIVRNQIDLETTRQELANQCKKLISEFGRTEVEVKMSLEKRAQMVPVKEKAEASTKETGQGKVAEVVANGEGKIKIQTPAVPSPKNPGVQTVLVKRLLGIDVSIQKNVVNDYLQKHMGLENEATDEQFSRGVVAVRNEITKTIVSWIRNQGIDVSSDVVSVSVMPAEFQEEMVSDVPPATGSLQVTYYAAGAIMFVVVSMLVALTLKSRVPGERSDTTQQFSGAGREFVSRNQATTGSVLADEVNEVIQFDPDRSAQAFQNLVSGELNS